MGEVKWMREKKYGVMVHYLSNIQPRREKERFSDWNAMVDAFDGNRFVDDVERMGAGWVIFPFGQNSGHYCSPNSMLDGWWFDGCYNSVEKDFLRTHGWSNERFDYGEWKAAACAGNPDAVIAMCPGAEAMGYAFREQDYLAGEASTLNHKPDGPLIEGMQWHCLIWLDCRWGHWKQVGEIEAPRFTDEELMDFYQGCMENGGAVTWNVGIYQDGQMAEKTVEQIIRLKLRF